VVGSIKNQFFEVPAYQLLANSISVEDAAAGEKKSKKCIVPVKLG